ncbi:HAD-like domain-containing protein [Xylariaceae sp. FL0255]|nr:HAD-like domain-containing protein [Xylariaceae sp. FL0255]
MAEEQKTPSNPSEMMATPATQTAIVPLKAAMPYTDLIFDLGDVLSFWSGKGLDLPVDSRQLGYMLSGPEWCDHECGLLSRKDCFAKLTNKYGVQPEDMQKAIDLLAGSLKYNYELIKTIRNIKFASKGTIRVHLMTNITADDWKVLKEPVESWDIFDNIFTSFSSGHRKPELACYQQMLRRFSIDSRTAVFIDDKPENVVAAQTLGMFGINFTSTEQAIAQLLGLIAEPVVRGEAWLRNNAKNMRDEASTGDVMFFDHFAQTLILEFTGDSSLVVLQDGERETYNVFIDPPVLTTTTFPDDVDTTAVTFLNVDGIAQEVKNKVMDRMLGMRTDDGLFLTYFDDNRPRIDPAVSASLLRLYYSQGRGEEVQQTLEYLYRVVETKAYMVSLRYYMHPEWFFYYLSDLVRKHQDPELVELRNLLKIRLQEHLLDPSNQDAWGTAMRCLAAQNMGLDCSRDINRLQQLQNSDGSWKKDSWIYRYGSSGILVGCGGLVTAAAVRALKRATQAGQHDPLPIPEKRRGIIRWVVSTFKKQLLEKRSSDRVW